MHFLVTISCLVILTSCGRRLSTPQGNRPVSPTPVVKSSKAESCVLRLKPAQGQSFRFELAMGTGSKAQMTIGFTMVAEKVASDRTTFLTTISGMQMQGQSTPDDAMAAIKKIRTWTVMDSLGKWISCSAEGLPPGESAPNTTFGVSFPTSPVHVGDSWSGTSTSEGKQVTVRCKLVGFETIDQSRVAVVEVSSPDDLGLTIALNGPQKLCVELSTGLPIRASMRARSKEDGENRTLWAELRRL